MAAPPNRLRAHNRGPTRAREIEQPHNSLPKVFALHVISIAAKRFVAPSQIVRIGAGAAPAAKFGKMQIFDARVSERGCQIFAIEVRIASRPGKAAHVDEYLDFERFERVNEIFDRERRVADCPK